MTIEAYVTAMTVIWGVTGVAGLPLSLYSLLHAKHRLSIARRLDPYDPLIVLIAEAKVKGQTITALMFLLMLIVLIAALALPVGALRTGVNSTLVVVFGIGLLAMTVMSELTLRRAEKISGIDTTTEADVPTQKQYDDARNVKRDAEHDALTDPLRAAAFESAAAETARKEKEDA